MKVGPIIDVHSHAFPRSYVRLLELSQAVPLLASTWDVSWHLEQMERFGILGALLSAPITAHNLPVSESRKMIREINEELADCVARSPVRLGAFASIDLSDIHDAVVQVAYALDTLGLDGVSCAAHWNGSYLGDARYALLFEELNRRGAALFVHPNVPLQVANDCLAMDPSNIESVFQSTRMIANMVRSGSKKTYPNIHIIVANGASALSFLNAGVSLADTSSMRFTRRRPSLKTHLIEGLNTFYFDLTGATAAVCLDAAREFVPHNRLFMGFDYPALPSSTIAPSILSLLSYKGYRYHVKRKILSENAQELFQRFG